MMALIKDWVWLVTAIGPFLLGIGLLYLRSQFPTKVEHAAAAETLRAEHAKATGDLKKSITELTAQVEERRSDTDRRLIHLEAVTEHLPTRSDIAALDRRMSDVERQSAVTAETVRGVERIVAKVDRTVEMVLANQIQDARS
ncbi:DUF2730 domain-containing protein [Xanthobacter autotrophicus]|uniref:DUF2730 family protein n=1 Tax=Xanthobacter TaxID=279 RepID=UPI0024AA1924|nr:DUF2730 family protein [Xanthobacter autotrophicus]MDI4664699.1 DUF2730 domain-containing protein [Xanthobacter autotrophicus]